MSPKVKVATKTSAKKDKPEPIVQCSACGKFKRKSEFYTSFLPSHSETETLPYCKDCTKQMCVNKKGIFEKSRILSYLKSVDRPYIDVIYQKAEKTNNIIGNYLKILNLGQYKFLRWEDGDLDLIVEEEKAEDAKKIDDAEESKENNTNIEVQKTEQERMNDFVVTDEDRRLFGQGFTDEEYYRMRNKYEFLNKNYTGQTSMHTEALTTYVRYKVKEEMAIVNNKPNDAKIWGDLAMKQAERAKINPNQFSKADLQGGISTISEIAQTVEQNVDIIPILPQFLWRPNDAVDFCIWNYINYARDLEGKPLVEYKDVYKFYDKMKEDYIKSEGDPNGIFKNDPTVENRKKVEQYIKLPDEYYEDVED